MAMRRTAISLLLAGLLVAIGSPEPCWGGESALGDAPAPESVKELDDHLERGFEEEEIPDATLFPRVKHLLRDLPPFFRDTDLKWNTRSYYFDQRNQDDSRAQAWALGGALSYRSGWFKEFFSIGAVFYVSQKLIGKQDRDGTRLLKPEQRSFTVLGQSYARLRYRDHRLTLYRQELNLPYVNRQDSRMAPNTFEGYTLMGSFSELPRIAKLEYGAGYLTRMKQRDDDDFISMSEAAGVPAPSSHGLSFAGVKISPFEGFSFGAIDYFVKDTINIAYATGDYLQPLGDDLALRFHGQFSHQRSVGNDELPGSPFSTWVVGGRVAASYRYFVLSLAAASVDDGAAIVRPFGSYPGFVSLMQSKFSRAGEDSWLVGISYHFTRLGLEGLSAAASYAEGYGALDPDTGSSLPDRREFNLTVDYHVEKGRLRGFWLRVRGSILDTDGADRNSKQLRVILNYSLPVL
jgi:hypothetical protein